MKKNVFTENTIDADGVITSKRWITKEVNSIEHFVKLYLDDLRLLSKLTASQHRVLQSLVMFLEYNTNEFFLNPTRRKQIADQSDITINTFNQALSRLVKKNFILKTSANTYQMNPKIFFSGDELSRSKILELSVRYILCPDC